LEQPLVAQLPAITQHLALVPPLTQQHLALVLLLTQHLNLTPLPQHLASVPPGQQEQKQEDQPAEKRERTRMMRDTSASVMMMRYHPGDAEVVGVMTVAQTTITAQTAVIHVMNRHPAVQAQIATHIHARSLHAHGPQHQFLHDHALLHAQCQRGVIAFWRHC